LLNISSSQKVLPAIKKFMHVLKAVPQMEAFIKEISSIVLEKGQGVSQGLDVFLAG